MTIQQTKVSSVVQGFGRTYTGMGLGLAADIFEAMTLSQNDLIWLFVLTDGELVFLFRNFNEHF